MKFTKFIFKCIFEGLKFIMPAAIIMISIFVLCNYITLKFGEDIVIAFCITVILLFIAFVIGIIKLENDRLKELE